LSLVETSPLTPLAGELEALEGFKERRIKTWIILKRTTLATTLSGLK
jgi:hypothetical protein